MASASIPNKKSPVSPRQVARILARGLVAINVLAARLEGEAMAQHGQPAMLLDVADPTGPNGMRTFLITVTEV